MSLALSWARRYLVRLCLVLALTLTGTAAEVPPSPTPHYVLDEAGWLRPETFRELDGRLQVYERETSSQLLVALFRKLPEGAELTDFSQRVFDAWKPGQADEDNGAILFVFADDRKLRIHTGYGLEGALPDARCKQIISEVIAPLLRENRREEAVVRGTEAMIAAAKGEYAGTGETRLDRREAPLPLLFFFIIVLLLFIHKAKRGGGGGYPDIIITGGGTSHGDWGGSFGGGGWSSDGGGGGGFSGGGGMSGGGGASGDW